MATVAATSTSNPPTRNGIWAFKNSVTSPVTVTEPAPNQPPTAAFTHTAEHLTVSV